jgi:hypothetical protein
MYLIPPVMKRSIEQEFTHLDHTTSTILDEEDYDEVMAQEEFTFFCGV